MQEENEHPEGEEDDKTVWLYTLCDMNMILVGFFLLMFSLSSSGGGGMQETINSIRQTFGTSKSARVVQMPKGELGLLVNEAMLRKQLEVMQGKLFADIQYSFAQHGLEGEIGATIDKGIITLRVPSDVLFTPGEAQLTPKGKEIMQQLKDVFIQHHDQDINIKGYTADLEPQKSSRFADNWELSAMRAVNVLRTLVDLGIEPNRLTATGLADLNPLAPNTDDTNRAKNRRVEFALEKRIGG